MTEKVKNDDKNEQVPLMPFIIGEKISLLPRQKSHVKLYTKWNNDEKVRKYNRNEFPEMIQDVEQYFKPDTKPYKNNVFFEILHHKDNKIIGTVGIHHIYYIARRGEIGLT
ncbi:MAG: GNAT family N-acetyltransferase, partial [Promethearchaeota archaeon]